MKTAGRHQHIAWNKKKMVAIRLRPDLAKWLREQTESQSVLIENALVAFYRIEEPDQGTWFEHCLKEAYEEGRADAEKGEFHALRYDENYELEYDFSCKYKLGFMTRIMELGRKFKWVE